MRNGAKLLSDEVPLPVEAGAEPVFPAEAGYVQSDLAMSLLLGNLVAGTLLALGTVVQRLL